VPQEYGEDRLVFRLSSEDAVELDRLGDGFAALAREYQRHLAETGLDPTDAQARLFVTRVETGSIEFEVATVLGAWASIRTAVEIVSRRVV
jgi:hypothetical protein